MNNKMTSRVFYFSLLLRLTLGLSAIGSVACSSAVLKADNAQELLKNDEFEQAIAIKEIPATPVEPAAPTPAPVVSNPGPPHKAARSGKAPLHGKKKAQADKDGKIHGKSEAVPAREPFIEDSEGFKGRRPMVDPYRVGEKVTLEVSYFSVVAGDMTLEVRPFVEANNRKSYRFAGTAVSTSVFAMFYAVDDWFETFVDYETLTPSSYALHVKESKQLRETRSIFNWQKHTASYWDKRINSEKQVEEKKHEWEIPAFSQNVFSAPFYLRSFQLKPGKKILFRIAHDKDNLILTADVLRRERIKTPAGEFDTVVVKPTIELNGIFKPMGDIFIWFTDDDRKLVVKLESKIKIGKILAIAKRVELGN